MTDLAEAGERTASSQVDDWTGTFAPLLGTTAIQDRGEAPLEASAPWLRPSPITRQLLAELDEVARGDDHWPGAVAPAPQAWRDARAFVSNLPRSLVHLPNIGLATDGEVNFLWKHDRFHIDLGFYGSGTFSYYARDEAGKEYLGDARSATDGLPSEVATLIAT